MITTYQTRKTAHRQQRHLMIGIWPVTVNSTRVLIINTSRAVSRRYINILTHRVCTHIVTSTSQRQRRIDRRATTSSIAYRCRSTLGNAPSANINDSRASVAPLTYNSSACSALISPRYNMTTAKIAQRQCCKHDALALCNRNVNSS